MGKKIIPQEEKVIVKWGTGDYREYRIPGIAVTKDALLMTFEGRCGVGEKNLGDWGDIDVIVLRMEKGGEPVEVLRIGESALPEDGTMRTYNNPTIIADGDRAHLIYHKNYYNVYQVTSEDGGKTWGEPKEITDVYRQFPINWTVSATGPGHGICTSSGRLIATTWISTGKKRPDGTVEHIPQIGGCIYSDDHGETWKTGHLLPYPSNSGEVVVTELENGKLMFNYRNQCGEKCRLQSISADGGETVESVALLENLIDPHCFGALASCKGGVLFANCNSTEKRIDTCVKFSGDEGKTWELIWEADPMSGYVDIVTDGEEVYLFYERQDYAMDQIREIVLQKGKLVEE